VSTHPEPNGDAESLGVRRPVELPTVNTEAADDLAPASDTRPEAGSAADSGGTDATAENAAASRPDEATAAEEKAQSDTAASAIAVAASPDTDDADGAGAPPDRPNKPVLAAVAIGGAVVLAIPILLIGTGHHGGDKHRTAAAANTVMSGDGQPAPGAYVSASPTPTPTPTPSASPKHKAKPAKKDGGARKRSTSVAKHAAFTGVGNVLLKNAGSKLCADVPGYGNGSVDGPVNQYPCALGDADNQVWSLGVMQDLKGPGGAPLFVIRNVKDDYCMDLPYYGAHAAGAKVTEYYCRPTKSDNQLWYRTHTRGHLYRIRNYASHGLCLGVTGRSRAADKQLEIQKCGSGDEWSWPSGA
jgi:Ricin-type beta-trefoil lectin domain